MAVQGNPSGAAVMALFCSQGGEEWQLQPFFSPFHQQSLQLIKVGYQSKEGATPGSSGSQVTFKNYM